MTDKQEMDFYEALKWVFEEPGRRIVGCGNMLLVTDGGQLMRTTEKEDRLYPYAIHTVDIHATWTPIESWKETTFGEAMCALEQGKEVRKGSQIFTRKQDKHTGKWFIDMGGDSLDWRDVFTSGPGIKWEVKQ